MKTNKIVRIGRYPIPLLIVPCSSKLIVEHQTGGIACHQDRLEGVILPVPIEVHSGALDALNSKLEEIHPGCYGQPPTEDEANTLDTAFLELKIPLVVNRAKLQDSTEAWLHVRFRDKSERWLPPIPEAEIQSFYEDAKKYNPNPVTLEHIRGFLDASRIGDTSIYADFSGQEAVLIWENCD